MSSGQKPDRREPSVAAPALLLKWQTWAVGMAVMLVPFFLPIPIALRRHPIISPLGDQLHVVLLAGIALFLYWRGPLTGRLPAAALAATIIGGAIEFIQIPFGRHAAWQDFVADLVGIGLAVGYVMWRGNGRRAGLGLMLVLLMYLPAQLWRMPFVAAGAYRAQEIFPLIANLESPRDRWLWHGNEAKVDVIASPDSAAQPNHVVRLVADPPHPWSSAEMRRFPHDWSQFAYLVLDVRLVEGPADTQRFGVQCDDFLGRRERNWISTPATANHSWQTFRIPLVDRAVTDGTHVSSRLFDRQDVDRLMITLSGCEARVVLEIDNLRLE